MSSGEMLHKRNFMHTQTLKVRENIGVFYPNTTV